MKVGSEALAAADTNGPTRRCWGASSARVTRGVFIARCKVATTDGLIGRPFCDVSAHVIEGPSRTTLSEPAACLEGSFISVCGFGVTHAAPKTLPIRKGTPPLTFAAAHPLSVRTQALACAFTKRLRGGKIDTGLGNTSFAGILIDIHAVGLSSARHFDRLVSRDARATNRLRWETRRGDNSHPTRATQSPICGYGTRAS